MARSHHRKKHKEHLRQFRHSQENKNSSTANIKTTGIFTFLGAATGFAISYFANGFDLIWTIVGMLAGGAVGYYLGRNVDSNA